MLPPSGAEIVPFSWSGSALRVTYEYLQCDCDKYRSLQTIHFESRTTIPAVAEPPDRGCLSPRLASSEIVEVQGRCFLVSAKGPCGLLRYGFLGLWQEKAVFR